MIRSTMLDTIIRLFIRGLLWLRYRITVIGLQELQAQDNRGILFQKHWNG